MIYEHDDPKFPPDGYVVIARWNGKSDPPGFEASPGKWEERPRKVTYKRKDLVSASEEAKKWSDLGYSVLVFQTVNLLVFNSDKDIK